MKPAPSDLGISGLNGRRNHQYGGEASASAVSAHLGRCANAAAGRPSVRNLQKTPLETPAGAVS